MSCGTLSEDIVLIVLIVIQPCCSVKFGQRHSAHCDSAMLQREVRTNVEMLRHGLWREIMHLWCCWTWCKNHEEERNEMCNITNDMVQQDMFLCKKQI